jgi:hypothetical protein
LLRTDPWGYPLVYPKGAFIVTTGSDRRETGAHYTPKSLTEAIVVETLTPVAYIGPAEGKPKADWILKSPSELLSLKICDPAMGSGAFLVQACRWLAERLVEAWSRTESSGQYVTVDGEVRDTASGEEPLPRDVDERTIIARRLIAERCLYGVDLNPLAVELAKLSIWLVTLAKGRPFGFLDHNLRCGDSLLGIHRLDQLTELSMTPGQKNTQMRLFGRNIEQAVVEAKKLRTRLRQMPIRDIHDVEAMAELDADAKRRLETPERIADAFIAEVFKTGGSGSSLDVALTTLSIEAEQYLQGDTGSGQHIQQRTNRSLSIDLPEGKGLRKPFHWPLEFPEVFSGENAGFDAMIGNPPFLGGQRITGVAGTAYRDWLVSAIAQGRRGSADLVAYFFLRVYSLLRKGGGFGLIAVNTISEGDTRQVGLEAMIKEIAVIHAAYPNEPWPGKAAVVTSRVHVHKGEWQGHRILLGKTVTFISAFLTDQEEWSPKRLKANEDISFQGSIVLGMGFVLTDDEAKAMLESDPKNTDVIFPYLNGEDLNSNPDQRPRRWAINFWDWPEEQAALYREPYKWVLTKVKPERQRLNNKGEFVLRRPLPERWWQYGEKRPGLYHTIGRGNHFKRHPENWGSNIMPMERVIGVTRVSKYLNAAFLPNDIVFTLDLFIFALNKYSDLALLQSNIFAAWAWSRGGRMKHDLRFSGSDVFETFPLPHYRISVELDSLGKEFHLIRSRGMGEKNIGLTKITNLINSPTVQDSDIVALRHIWSRIDVCIIKMFGWDDIDLSHDFHEVAYRPESDRLRYTISEHARTEVLQRLSALNRQHYEEEVVACQHDKPSIKTKLAISNKKTKTSTSQLSLQTDVFDIPDQTDVLLITSPITKVGNTWGLNATDQILAWLEAHDGWFPKQTILNGSGTSPDDWDDAVVELLADQFVEIQGNGESARYRAKPLGSGKSPQ